VPAGNAVTLLNESRAKTANVVDDPKTTVVKNAPAPVLLDAQTIPD
jgi:hypothetical protein